MGAINCTVGHTPYAFSAYCINKTTSSVSPAEYRLQHSVRVTSVPHK